MTSSTFVVFKGSPLIGKDIRAIEEEYGIKIKNIWMQDHTVIEVEGAWDNVAKVSKASCED